MNKGLIRIKRIEVIKLAKDGHGDNYYIKKYFPTREPVCIEPCQIKAVVWAKLNDLHPSIKRMRKPDRVIRVVTSRGEFYY